jgi:hypothetical protein
MRGLDHENDKFMYPFYLISHTLKVWDSSFEPYLDPTQWPAYYGLDYVLDPNLLRTKKGRRKKNGFEELWTNRTGIVKICTVHVTLMRHRVKSVAPNATEQVIPLPLMTNI